MEPEQENRVRIERSIAVQTTPMRAYKVLSDPTNIPRYAPDIEAVLVTRMTPDLVGTQMTLITREHDEFTGEIVEADMPNACAFRTERGRTTRWSIENDGEHIRLVNTIESDEPLDTKRLGPELERKLRTLRNAFLQGLRN